jgi:hypothetical protein
MNNSSNRPDVAVGELVYFEITYGFYEGNTSTVTLQDIFDNKGFVYVPGSMTINRSDDNLTIGNFPLPPAGVDMNVSDGFIAATSSGIAVSVGDVINSNISNNNTSANLVLKFKVKVQNISRVKILSHIRNTGNTHFIYKGTENDSGGTEQLIVDVVEPIPQITKDVNQTTVEAGDIIHYTLKICNGENNTSDVTTGFDWIIFDDIPDELNVSNITTSSANVSINQSSPDINASIAELATGQCETIEYDAAVAPSVQYDQNITNTVTVTATSLQ